ncbi:hypothetical protein JYU34_002606 [Plutella xylostella]|uniref:Uncharacterized protein n=1 Tax=Plutella xylostella TaxID=51655 RepID=A0ABQ7R2P1_PLUXY|nr:hypothetical protein JYU34_002606 [Plutella xylostella]
MNQPRYYESEGWLTSDDTSTCLDVSARLPARPRRRPQLQQGGACRGRVHQSPAGTPRRRRTAPSRAFGSFQAKRGFSPSIHLKINTVNETST